MIQNIKIHFLENFVYRNNERYVFVNDELL